MVTETAGLIHSTLHVSFRNLQIQLKDKAMPELKEQLALLSRSAQAFSSAGHALVNEMRKISAAYYEKTGKSRSQQNDSDIGTVILSVCDFGSTIHAAFSDLYARFESCEQKMNQELTKAHSVMTNALKSEDKIIRELVQTLSVGFPFAELVKAPRRTLNSEDSIRFWQTKISSAFFSLKSGESKPIYCRGTIPKEWVNREVSGGFYARVWGDFDADSEGKVRVQRKEIVLVLRAGSSYWDIERSNGERGCVPSAVLEPVN
jgi:hypothetical protein